MCIYYILARPEKFRRERARTISFRRDYDDTRRPDVRNALCYIAEKGLQATPRRRRRPWPQRNGPLAYYTGEQFRKLCVHLCTLYASVDTNFAIRRAEKNATARRFYARLMPIGNTVVIGLKNHFKSFTGRIVSASVHGHHRPRTKWIYSR